jgi:lipopolysaccharide transport system permease protein
MFASPVIYPSSIVPDKWRWALWLNPMTGIIEGFRAALFNRKLDMAAIAVATVLTFALLICAAYAFRRTEDGFADII